MNLKEYKEKLIKHDWYYRMSDDPRWYRKGLAEEDELKELAIGKKTYQEAYDKMYNKIFKNEKTTSKQPRNLTQSLGQGKEAEKR